MIRTQLGYSAARFRIKMPLEQAIKERTEGVIDDALIGCPIRRSQLGERLGLLAEQKGLDVNIHAVAEEIHALAEELFYSTDDDRSTEIARAINKRRHELLRLKLHRLQMLVDDPDARKTWEKLAS